MSNFKRPHYQLNGHVMTPSTAEARALQSEHELFDALEQGLRCAQLAAKRLAYARQDSRWVQVGLLIESMEKRAKALGRRRASEHPIFAPDGTRVN